jgi:hypothetical protein
MLIWLVMWDAEKFKRVTISVFFYKVICVQLKITRRMCGSTGGLLTSCGQALLG